jgi:hypothetical protein
LLYEDYNREATWHFSLPIPDLLILPGVNALKQKTDSLCGISSVVL